MADELPTGDKAVFAFLEIIALAFAFEGAARLLDGKFLSGLLALGIAIVIFIAAVEWPDLKSRIGRPFAVTLDRVANDSRYRITAAALTVLYIAISSLVYMRSVRTDLDSYVMPRRVTSRQVEDLREYLTHRESYAVTVKVNPADTEASNYASAIHSALTQAGWEVAYSTSNGDPPSTAGDGLCLHEQGQSKKPDPKHDPVALLSAAFRAAHIEVNCGGGSGTGDYKLFVLVGHRPLFLRPQ